MSDRQGADVNWLVLQALIKSAKSPFSFHFLLQGQLTRINGKREKRRRVPKARCAGEWSLAPHSRSRAWAASGSARARAPAEHLLCYHGYIKHLSAFYASFFFSSPHYFFFISPLLDLPCLARCCWSRSVVLVSSWLVWSLFSFSPPLPALNLLAAGL